MFGIDGELEVKEPDKPKSEKLLSFKATERVISPDVTTFASGPSVATIATVCPHSKGCHIGIDYLGVIDFYKIKIGCDNHSLRNFCLGGEKKPSV